MLGKVFNVCRICHPSPQRTGFNIENYYSYFWTTVFFLFYTLHALLTDLFVAVIYSGQLWLMWIWEDSLIMYLVRGKSLIKDREPLLLLTSSVVISRWGVHLSHAIVERGFDYDWFHSLCKCLRSFWSSLNSTDLCSQVI